MYKGMKGLKRKGLLAWILIAAMVLSGCSGIPGISRLDGKSFDKYMEKLFLEEVVTDTLTLHYTLAYPENFGITDYDITLGSFSEEEDEETIEEIKELQSFLEKYQEEDLTKEQNLTREILLDYLDTELALDDFDLYGEVLSPSLGYQAQLPVILAEYTFRTERDIEDYFGLLGEIDPFFREIVDYEQRKADAGLFMADYTLDSVIDQCEQFIAAPDYMIEIFDDKIDAFEGLTEEQRSDYKEKNKELVNTDVVNGYQMLIDELEKLRGSGKNELGLSHFDRGEEYYQLLVRLLTGSDDTVEELMDRTEKFMNENIELMVEIIKENSRLYNELSNYEFALTEPEDIMLDLIGKVAEDFPTPPDVNYTIKYVNPALQEYTSPAFYLIPPIDDMANNTIYVNEKYFGQDDPIEIYATMAHEGYPGHLYQHCYYNATEAAHIRSMLSYQGYSEGWATYVKQYAYGISGLDENLAELLAINNAVMMAMHAYIDMGVNYMGWDKKEVGKYLHSQGISGAEWADTFLQAMVEDPGNYLSYFIGYLEILDLREKAEEELGGEFVLKDFHQFLLEIGPAPFYIIEDYMEEWIEEQDVQ